MICLCLSCRLSADSVKGLERRTFIAEWIAVNLCGELNIPDKQSLLWTAAELNAIIAGNLVGGPHGHLSTFGWIQWGNILFSCRPKARCNPFNIQGHRFRNKNTQVHALYRARYRYHHRVAPCCIISYPISHTILYTISGKILYDWWCCLCRIASVLLPLIHSGLNS